MTEQEQEARQPDEIEPKRDEKHTPDPPRPPASELPPSQRSIVNTINQGRVIT